MSRPIKFRAWTLEKEMVYFELGNLYGGELDNGTHILDSGVPVMQFTGLLDKNSKEIYEGDVMVFPKQEGVWSDQVGYQVVGWPFICNNANLGKIIGNIYENPELVVK